MSNLSRLELGEAAYTEATAAVKAAVRHFVEFEYGWNGFTGTTLRPDVARYLTYELYVWLGPMKGTPVPHAAQLTESGMLILGWSSQVGTVSAMFPCSGVCLVVERGADGSRTTTTCIGTEKILEWLGRAWEWLEIKGQS